MQYHGKATLLMAPREPLRGPQEGLETLL